MEYIHDIFMWNEHRRIQQQNNKYHWEREDNDRWELLHNALRTNPLAKK